MNSNSTAEAVLRHGQSISIKNPFDKNSNSTAEAVLRLYLRICSSFYITNEFKFYCGSGIETSLMRSNFVNYLNSNSTAEAVLRQV